MLMLLSSLMSLFMNLVFVQRVLKRAKKLMLLHSLILSGTVLECFAAFFMYVSHAQLTFGF
jgi:hypothetical protein